MSIYEREDTPPVDHSGDGRRPTLGSLLAWAEQCDDPEEVCAALSHHLGQTVVELDFAPGGDLVAIMTAEAGWWSVRDQVSTGPVAEGFIAREGVR